MTAPKPLTRKAGPLPVWAWALAVVAAYLAYRHLHAGSTVDHGQTPVVPNVTGSSAAQQPSAGMGTAADNSSNDLLSALNANTAAADALLTAVQGGSGTGGMGIAGGSGTTGSASGASTVSSTSTVTAPTVDSGVNNAPADPYAAAVSSAQSTTPDYGLIAAEIPVSTADQGFALENATLANPATDYGALTAALGIPTIADIQTQLQAMGDAIPNPTSTVTAPTPTVVQPAPVDTSSVYFQPSTGRSQVPTPAHGVWAS